MLVLTERNWGDVLVQVKGQARANWSRNCQEESSESMAKYVWVLKAKVSAIREALYHDQTTE